MEFLLLSYVWIAAIMLAIGVIWSPFAVIIGLLVTRQRRRVPLPEDPSTKRFVCVTALHSVAMVSPWIQLFAYWIDKPVLNQIAKFGYVLMYLRWFFSPAWIGLYLGLRGIIDALTNSRGIGEIALDSAIFVMSASLLGFNWYALFRLFIGMMGRKSQLDHQGNLLFPSNDLYYLRSILLWLVMDVGTILIGFYGFFILWGIALSYG